MLEIRIEEGFISNLMYVILNRFLLLSLLTTNNPVHKRQILVAYDF